MRQELGLEPWVQWKQKMSEQNLGFQMKGMELANPVAGWYPGQEVKVST